MNPNRDRIGQGEANRQRGRETSFLLPPGFAISERKLLLHKSLYGGLITSDLLSPC